MDRQRRVLVTGGAGYIGSHTCKALAQAGHLPVVFDDLSNGHREAVKWGPLVIGDICDGAALRASLDAHRIDSVIHFAGLIEVGLSVREPTRFWRANVEGVLSLLEAMRDRAVDRLVFSSTAAVYGQPETGAETLDEALPLNPINPYGDTKLAAERLIAAAARAQGLSALALRYFNAAGADPDGETGEAHHTESHLIPLAIEAALGFGPPLTLYGDDFETADGSCVRDYVHVADLARAHVLALETGAAPGAFEALNLGLGRGHSVLEVVRTVEAACGRAPACRRGPRRPGDPPRLVADPSAAVRRLGWRPVHTDLGAIVASAVAWRRRPAFGARLLAPLSEVA